MDLNDLIDPRFGWELIQAIGINDAGQIVGQGRIGGETHAFLMTPVPEGSSFALVVAAFATVLVSATMRSARESAVKKPEAGIIPDLRSSHILTTG
jgi:hypothetical protein